MLRAVVFHYNKTVRQQVVDGFRHAGFVTYDASDPQHAYNAVWTYRPHVVITDFPALLDDREAGPRTLTEAIRDAPALRDVGILNLSSHEEPSLLREARAAGVTDSLPASTPVGRIIEAVYDIVRTPDRA